MRDYVDHACLTQGGVSVFLHACPGCQSGALGSGVPTTFRAADETGWQMLAHAVTDVDGRYRYSELRGTDELTAGIYRVEFDTGSYSPCRARSGSTRRCR